jgi:acetyltransferase-like isoleucine patch superfamily enzyme
MKLKQWQARIARYWLWRRRFGHFGHRTIILNPMMIVHPRCMHVGDDTCIRDGARLEVVTGPATTWTPRLHIGNRVNIEQGVHIICQCSVTIEDDVSITPYCVIVDTDHPFDPPDRGGKIGERLPNRETHVHIGTGSFIGAHSVILPNVRIGRYCVIGAGSVVTRDLPDYSVAAGNPARIIKRFDPSARAWLHGSRALSSS